MRGADPAFLVVAAQTNDVVVGIEFAHRIDLLQTIPTQELSRLATGVRQVRIVATRALHLRLVCEAGRLQWKHRAHARTAQADFRAGCGIAQFAIRDRKARIER